MNKTFIEMSLKNINCITDFWVEKNDTNCHCLIIKTTISIFSIVYFTNQNSDNRILCEQFAIHQNCYTLMGQNICSAYARAQRQAAIIETATN